ncbi:hypothetical protein D3C87_1574950 [compost metagenome]
MRNGRRARQRQACHHRDDGGEGNGGQEAQQQVAAYRVCQVHGHHVGAADQAFEHVELAVRAGGEVLGMAHQQRHRAKADDEGQQVEVADE